MTRGAALPLSAMLADLEDLVLCEPFSADHAAVARSAEVVGALGARLLRAGPEVIVIGGVTHLRWSFGAPRVLLVGHHATVWPMGSLQNRPWPVADGIARGPGVLDMKAGLVQMFHAVLPALPGRGVRTGQRRRGSRLTDLPAADRGIRAGVRGRLGTGGVRGRGRRAQDRPQGHFAVRGCRARVPHTRAWNRRRGSTPRSRPLTRSRPSPTSQAQRAPPVPPAPSCERRPSRPPWWRPAPPSTQCPRWRRCPWMCACPPWRRRTG